MAVVLASSFKMFTGALVRRGMTPVRDLAATHCNTLQHTATHCNTATYRKMFTGALVRRGMTPVRDLAAAHCNTLKYTATYCKTIFGALHNRISPSFCRT